MNVFKCYTRDQLRDFILGNLNDDVLEQVTQHLEECVVCEDTVVGLDGSQDTLITHLNGGDQIESVASSDNELADDPNYRAALSQIIGDAENLAHLSHLISRHSDSEHPTQIGDYQVTETLARGGMGSVFKARHTRLEKMVAIKILPERKMRNPDAIARFAREMKIIGQMSHPSMVGATDAGEDNGTHYLVMELVDGMDLGKIVRNCGPLRPDDACELVRQAALGLEYAHQQQVIHRDVKPSNLMLGRDKAVKVLDLGLATLSGLNGCVDELTTVGQMMGTLDYMAPEQAGNDFPVDRRSDVYGLAATLYKLLTGTAPYSHPDNSTPLKKLKAMATEDPIPVRNRNQEIHVALAALIDSCLSREPADRVQTAMEFADQLQPFCTNPQLSELLQRAEVISESKVKRDVISDPKQIFNKAIHSPTQRPQKTTSSNRPKSNSGRGRIGSFVRIAAMFGGAAAIIWASITIYLNTISGQLIIESEIEDIKVTVLHDGKPTKDLQIEHGTESTKLYAGKYRIEINGPSDGLVVENDTFEMRRGTTVVARIIRKPVDSRAKSNSKTNTDTDSATVVSHQLRPNDVSRIEKAMTLYSDAYEDKLGPVKSQPLPDLGTVVLSGAPAAILKFKSLMDQLGDESPGLQKLKDFKQSTLARYREKLMELNLEIKQHSRTLSAAHPKIQHLNQQIEYLQKAVETLEKEITPFLKAYNIQGDVDVASRILQSMLDGHEGVRMDIDKKESRVIILGTVSQHGFVEELLQQFNNPVKEPSGAISIDEFKQLAPVRMRVGATMKLLADTKVIGLVNDDPKIISVRSLGTEHLMILARSPGKTWLKFTNPETREIERIDFEIVAFDEPNPQQQSDHIIASLAPNEAQRLNTGIITLKKASDAFRLNTGRDIKKVHDLVNKPDEMNLQQWAGPYLRSLPNDPWGNPFQISSKGDNGQLTFESAGPDKKWNTGDEITQSNDGTKLQKSIVITPPPIQRSSQFRSAGDTSDLTPIEAKRLSDAIKLMQQAATAFRMDVGRDIESVDDLVSLPSGLRSRQWGGPYLNSIPRDAWGTTHRLSQRKSSDGKMMFQSAGPDKKWNTGDEIHQTYDADSTSLAKLQPPQMEPTFSGGNLANWVENYITGNSRNSRTALLALIKRSNKEKLSALIQETINKSRNELSAAHQKKIIAVINYLSEPLDDRKLMLDYVHSLQRDLSIDELLDRERKDELWSTVLRDHPQECLDYLHKLVTNGDSKSVAVAIQGLDQFVKRNAKNKEDTTLAKRWLTTLINAYNSDIAANSEPIRAALIHKLSMLFDSQPETIALFEKVVSSKKPTKEKAAALVALAENKPNSDGLVKQIDTLIAQNLISADLLVDLVPDNPNALPMITRYLQNSDWGNKTDSENSNSKDRDANDLMKNLMGGGGGGMAVLSDGGGMVSAMGGGAAGDIMRTMHVERPQRWVLINAIAQRYSHKPAQTHLRTLIPILEKELESGNNPQILEATWVALERITGREIPPLFQGREYSYWLNQLNSSKDADEKLESLVAIERLATPVTTDLEELVLAIVKSARGFSFVDLSDPESHRLQIKIRDMLSLTIVDNIRRFNSNSSTRRRNTSKIQYLLCPTLFQVVDELENQDSMLLLQVMEKMGQSGINALPGKLVPLLAKTVVRLTKSEDAMTRRRALNIGAIIERRFFDGEFHYGIVDNVRSAENYSDQTRLAFLSRISNLLKSQRYTWTRSNTPYEFFEKSKDPRTKLTFMNLALQYEQAERVFSIPIGMLAEQPKYIDEKIGLFDLDLWGAPEIAAKPTEGKLTAFEQIVQFLDASPVVAQNSRRIRSSHLEYYRYNEELAQQGDQWESDKKKAFEYLKLRRSKSNDQSLNRKLDRIIKRLGPAESKAK